jgi:hypothetical protein
LKEKEKILAVILTICLITSVTSLGFIIDFSSGGTGPVGVEINLTNTPAKGVVLYCTYTITESNKRIIASSLMLHFPFSSEYAIDKTLTNLSSGNYTFMITIHYANGVTRTLVKGTFTVGHPSNTQCLR